MIRAGRALAALSSLGFTLTALHRLGEGRLAAPPSTAGELAGWLAERDAATAFFAIVRLVALGLGWYLALVTVAALLARLAGSARAIRWVDVITAPVIRPLIRSVVAAGVAGTSLVPAGAMAAQAPASTTIAVEPDGTATMRRLPPDPVATATDRQASAPREPAATWTVRPGDHLWQIAEHSLTRVWHRQPTDDETAVYWRALVERNRPRLPDPSNPDLVFAGLVVELPPAPMAPR